MAIVAPAIIADVKAKLDAQFGPVNAALQPVEKATLEASRQMLAVVIAQAGLHVQQNATLLVVGVMPGGGAASGTIL